MTETRPDIDAKVSRVEEIIDRLETGDISLQEAKDLREEGRGLLAELETDLDLGDGEVSE